MIIPYSKTNLGDHEKKFVISALDSGWISSGEFVTKFTEEFSEFYEEHGVTLTSNGTSALALAYLSINLSPGDEIVFPGFGFMAGANVAQQMGYKVKFADVSLSTFCLDVESLARVVSERTRAIVLIHTYGNCDDVSELVSFCRYRNIKVIEDCAEALGTRFNSTRLGLFGDVATFSFHSTKLITCGEGGAVLTKKREILERAELWKSHGLKRRSVKFGNEEKNATLKDEDFDYFHVLPGNNFRMSNVLAAIGSAQMSRIDGEISHRKWIGELYRKMFDGSDWAISQKYLAQSEIVPWSYPIRVKRENLKLGAVIKLMKERFGVECRRGFVAASRLNYFNCENVPNSERLNDEILSLPIFSGMVEREVKYVCEALERCM